MDNDDKKRKESNVDFDLFGLGGIFKNIEKLIDLAGSLEGNKAINKEGEIDLSHIKSGMRGVYGFTVKTATGGSPKVETFGNIKKTSHGPEINEEREPITDVYDEKDSLIIIAEMPGVDYEDIKIELKDDIIDINAFGKSKKYRKELLLNNVYVKDNMSYKYNNGMLEIILKK